MPCRPCPRPLLMPLRPVRPFWLRLSPSRACTLCVLCFLCLHHAVVAQWRSDDELHPSEGR
eukprot:15430565-Alexandrium_andersonii.AAC.1